MSRVAVTGATGFIGRYLCPALKAAGHDVLRLGRGDGPDLRRTDYTEPDLRAALEGVDAVIHLAGRRMTRDDAPMDLRPFWGPNVAAIADLAGAARDAGVGRIVLASTIAVYSAGSGLPYREDAPARPVNAYALSKLMAEQHLELLTRNAGPSSVSLRLAAVYGHGEKGTPALMRFAAIARDGGTITLTGNPGYVIDQIYVRDAVAAILAALASDVTGPVNIGGGVPWRVDQIAETASAVFGDGTSPDRDIDGTDPMPQTIMALDRAAETLGWHPRFDLRAGMEDFRDTALAEGA